MGCSSLHTLNLQNTKVRDVSALAECSLHTLSLGFSEVTDVAALAGCSSLHTLDLQSTGVRGGTEGAATMGQSPPMSKGHGGEAARGAFGEGGGARGTEARKNTHHAKNVPRTGRCDVDLGLRGRKAHEQPAAHEQQNGHAREEREGDVWAEGRALAHFLRCLPLQGGGVPVAPSPSSCGLSHFPSRRAGSVSSFLPEL